MTSLKNWSIFNALIVTSLGNVMLPSCFQSLSAQNPRGCKQIAPVCFLIYIGHFPIIAGMLIVNDDFVQFSQDGISRCLICGNNYDFRRCSLLAGQMYEFKS